MKALLENLNAARLALLALLLAAGLGALVAHYAFQARQDARQHLQQLQITLAEAQRKLSQSGNEQALVRQYLNAYQALQLRGFIGPDQRLAWRDALAEGARSLDIRDLKFSIAPQQPYAGGIPVDSGELLLRETPVNFSGQLFDENALARLIDTLTGLPNGIFGVRDCTLQRNAAQLTDLTVPQLQTQCSFVWYTLSLPAAGADSPAAGSLR